MLDALSLIGRKKELFTEDIQSSEQELMSIIPGSTFLVIGGAGSIGQAVVKELFRRNPKVLHVVDISENNLVELVRDIRSSMGYIDGDFQTFALDCGSPEFALFMESVGHYDYVLNLSALKHVRSERDPFTLMRMIDVNVLNTEKTLRLGQGAGIRKYFCVSTDKAANPVNLMGASKRIMELFLMRASEEICVSTARFANVAFSDGSLPHGFNQRILKRQPLSAPRDIRRYFVTAKESGELCMMSCLLGANRDIFFPKLSEELDLTTFADIAVRYLQALGYEPHVCATEDEARALVVELEPQRKWPCYFFDSDTTGEKDVEEFFTAHETLDMEQFKNVGIIKNVLVKGDNRPERFLAEIAALKGRSMWGKEEIVALFNEMLPELSHKEAHKNLDQRM
jgi:FlaA1/EpsC-like NDP-sugar epimerase